MIDIEQVRKVANLARLELSEDEQQQFTGQLNGILEYVQQLNELETDGVAPTTRAIEVSNITRPDEVEVFAEREAILESAPDREEDFFRVPKIMSGD